MLWARSVLSDEADRDNDTVVDVLAVSADRNLGVAAGGGIVNQNVTGSPIAELIDNLLLELNLVVGPFDENLKSEH